jgi:hypothetical protein
LNARQSHQHDWIVDVVIGHVVDVRRSCDEFCAIIKIDANSQRARFSGLMNGNTCQQLSANLELWSPVYRRILYVTKLTCQLPNCIEVDCRPSHARRNNCTPAPRQTRKVIYWFRPPELALTKSGHNCRLQVGTAEEKWSLFLSWRPGLLGGGFIGERDAVPSDSLPGMQQTHDGGRGVSGGRFIRSPMYELWLPPFRRNCA